LTARDGFLQGRTFVGSCVPYLGLCGYLLLKKTRAVAAVVWYWMWCRERQAAMGPSVDILAQHGWAFESSIWGCWREVLPDGWRLSTADRGYFHSPGLVNDGQCLVAGNHGQDSKENHQDRKSFEDSQQAWVSQGKNRALQILAAHSFGLHWLSPSSIGFADLLVIISGFEQFHESENALSRRAIRRMLVRLGSDYSAVLKDFYAACFGAAMPLFISSNLDLPCDLKLLTADLRQLDCGRVCMDDLLLAKSILILHGERDSVAPVWLAHSLHNRLPGSRLVIHPSAGHALPFTDPEWCLRQLEPTLLELCTGSLEVFVP
jgi:TAP-like protein